MSDFSRPETQRLFEAEVKKRMQAPFFLTRMQAEMLVATLMTDLPNQLGSDNSKIVHVEIEVMPPPTPRGSHWSGIIPGSDAASSYGVAFCFEDAEYMTQHVPDLPKVLCVRPPYAAFCSSVPQMEHFFKVELNHNLPQELQLLREHLAEAVYNVAPEEVSGEYVDGFQVSPGGPIPWEHALKHDAEFAGLYGAGSYTKHAYDSVDAVIRKVVEVQHEKPKNR